MTFDMRSMNDGLPSGPATGLIYTDITMAFRDAVADMKPGEVVKEATFSLFDSVAALEIMDPKMDINYAEAQKTTEPEYDVTRDLTAKETLGIIDQLLCQEMAWHIGYPLGLTLFTSHYVDRIITRSPYNIHDAEFIIGHTSSPDSLLYILRAYVIGLIRTCSLVIENITQEHYYEEEDFVTNTFGRSLFDHIPLPDIISELQTAKEALKSLLSTSLITETEATHLAARLDFRASFLNAIETSQDRGFPQRIRAAWESCQEAESRIQKSRSVGTPVPEAFSEQLQQKLSSSMPPRPMVDIGLNVGYDTLHTLICDSLKVTDVLGYVDPITVQNFVLYFQSKKPTPFVFVRSLLQRYLFKNFIVLGNISLRTLMDDDIRLTTDPLTPIFDPFFDFITDPEDPRATIVAILESFRRRAAQCYLDVYRSLCQNRCRVRRTLFHVVRDWDFLENESLDSDDQLRLAIDAHNARHPDQIMSLGESWRPLETWARLYKLRVMLLIIELGFELDVYLKHEMAGMYWYHTQIIIQLDAHYEQVNLHTRASSVNDNILLKHRYLYEITRISHAIKGHFSAALRCIYTLLTRLAAIQPPNNPCGTDKNRFSLRMRPFDLLTLEPPSYEVFRAAEVWKNASDGDLMAYVTKEIGYTATNLDKLAGMVGGHNCFTRGSLELQMESIKRVEEGLAAATNVVKTIQQVMNDKKMFKVDMIDEKNHYNDMWVVPTVSIVSSRGMEDQT